jgi:hypothetical protein
MNLEVSSWVGILSAVWLLFFVFGRWQFNRVKQSTTDMILNKARRVRRLHQNPSVEDFYTQIQPDWEAMLKKNAWFILHYTELFPVPAWPSIVKKRLKFTPAWTGAYLAVNGIKLPANADLEIEIEHIVMLSPKKSTKTVKTNQLNN